MIMILSVLSNGHFLKEFNNVGGEESIRHEDNVIIVFISLINIPDWVIHYSIKIL